MLNIGKRIWIAFGKCVHAILSILFKVMNKDLSDQAYEAFMQFIKFGIVGLSNTAISYILYVMSLLLFLNLGLFPQTDYVIASVIGFILSVLWSFYWNNKMVFKTSDGQKRSLWKTLIKTYVSYSFTGLFLSNALLILWVQVCHIPELIAPLINLLATVPLNFVINKFWAFREKK